MSTLQNQEDEDASMNPRQDLPSLHDETVVQRLNQCFTFWFDNFDQCRELSSMKKEDLEEVTLVGILEKSTTLEDMHLLQALPNLEEVRLVDRDTWDDTSGFSDEVLAAVLLGISALEKVKSLIINCYYLTSVPPNIGQLIQLQKLTIDGCDSITSVPPEIGQLIQLQKLDIWNCESLTSVPPDIGQLIQLQTLTITLCSSLRSVPPNIGQLTQLQKLTIDGCESLISVPPEIGQLGQLQKLKIDDCHSLTTMPPEIGRLDQLHTLNIGFCSSLTSVPPVIGLLKLIVHLSVLHSVSLVFGELTNLQDLYIWSCDSSRPLSPVSLQALPLQCSITMSGRIYKPFTELCNAKRCNISVGYERGCDQDKTFMRREMNPYFDWLQNYPVGAFKLQMLANKARQRAVAVMASPGGIIYERAKRSWETMQQGDS